MGIVYFIAQILGAFIGFGLLKALTPTNIFRPENADGAGLCSTVPHGDLTEVQTFFLEFFATMVLISLCCATWDQRSASNQDSVALKFGLAVSALSIAVVCILGPN